MDWWQTMPGNGFFREAILYVKQGNTGMGMSNMARSWASNGFGLWAHLVPDAGLPLVLEAMHWMNENDFDPGMPEHFPHFIYKPPGGKALGVHHDQMAPSELLANLRVHVSSDDPSTTGWVRRHGCQMLAHLKGGTGTKDGATFIIGPMTPAKLLVCLEAYSEGRLGGTYDKWNGSARGKIDLDWKQHLDGFNQVLESAGFERIGIMPAVPLEVLQGTSSSSSFAVCWPVGWPHGSFSNNDSEDPGRSMGSRITISLPITQRGSSQRPDARIPERLRNMAILAAGGRTADEYVAAETWLAQDLKPYAGGLSHYHPERVTGLIRHPDAPGDEVGPFWSISATVETVANYLESLGDLQGAPAAPVPVPMLVPLPVPMPSPSPSQSTPQSTPQGQLLPPRGLPLATRFPPRMSATQLRQSHAIVQRAAEATETELETDRAPAQPGLQFPPRVAVPYDDAQIIKVKQPWARLLVNGTKDVENRTWRLTPAKGFPALVLIASSKSKPTRKMMDELQDRLRRAAQHEGRATALEHNADPRPYEYSAILGMVRIEGCYKMPPRPSVWHNPPDFAWTVSKAWEFTTPIPLDPDDGMQTRASLAIRPQYRDRIVEEMRKLEARRL